MREIATLFVEIQTADGHEGLGFSYFKRAGGPRQFVRARELAPALVGENPNDIAKCWAGASEVALWDLKAKRANLSLAKLMGSHRDSLACYNTSGGFLHTPIELVFLELVP